MMKTQETMNAPELYEIRVAGHLSENWAVRFEGFSMSHEPGGDTVLSGMLDQAALHGVFVKIRDLGLKIISVNCVEDNGFEDVMAGNQSRNIENNQDL
ncbi:MAG TPA: hypothetical protein VLA72_03395 [Anaerolineales bacterium]|nr:hypothetical protein [Anaerolineales bacterium]